MIARKSLRRDDENGKYQLIDTRQKKLLDITNKAVKPEATNANTKAVQPGLRRI